MNGEGKKRQEELGNFLKTRRAKLQPEEVGIVDTGMRRTPGLRREEVSALANVSLTWYTWLEQGRDIQVSAGIIKNLAHALNLNQVETQHLYQLANITPPALTFFTSRRRVSPMVQHLIDNFDLSAAFIIDENWNVIATNQVMLLFTSNFKINPEWNVLWEMFTNQDLRATFPDWEHSAVEMVDRFRLQYDVNSNEQLHDLVSRLKERSPEFIKMWAHHDVELRESQLKMIQHPALGKLTFEETNFSVGNDVNLRLFVFTPVKGGTTEEKIRHILKQ